MVTRNEVKERALRVIREQMGREPGEDIDEIASFVGDMNTDSLDQVELVMKFEEEFEIKIPDEEAEELQTVGGAIDYICGALTEEEAEKGSPA
ncbi:MAG: acyl carrier protein [Patescibacteria group bacterium]|nr:acyl carrier protein [Patescibacteria group bacterium]